MSEYKFQQLEPATAHGTFRPEYMTSLGWTAEIKYDGDRRIAQFCDGKVRFTGRTVSKRTGLLVEKTENLPHLQGAEGKRSGRVTMELAGCVLDGEIVTPRGFVCGSGGRSKHVTSIMGSLPSEAIRKQEERGWLEYVVFDCLYDRGVDVRGFAQEARRARAAAIVKRWANPYVRLAEQCPVASEKESWLSKLYAAGEEGLILKRLDAPYGERQAWVKVKNEICADAFIVDYQEPKAESTKADGTVSPTRYAELGWIGALILAQYRDGVLWECASVSGLDDELRAAFSRDRKSYLDRVVEIKANAREPSGAFRHPVFSRFRDDKRPEDCVYRPDET